MYFDHEDIPDPTVADLDEFKQLPEETQRLAERVIGRSASHAYKQQWAGKRAADSNYSDF